MLGFLRENARWIVGGLLLTFLSSFGQTFFISLSSGELRALFGLTHGEFGWLYMLATLASAATLPFLGRIVDVITVSRTLVLIVPLLALACAAMAFAPNVWTLGIAIYALRLFGQGMMTHVALTAMGRWFEADRGRAVSIVVLGHQLGEMILPRTYASLLATGVEWRSIWLFCAVGVIAIGLPLAMKLLATERIPKGKAREGDEERRHWTRGEVLRDPIFWLIVAGVLAPAFIGTTIFFHQVYLVELRGWSLEEFANGFIVLGALTITATLATGRFVDRMGAVRLLPAFALPLAGACAVLANFQAAWAIYVFFALLGLSYGVSQTLFGALWPEVYGTKHLGSIRSVVVAMMVFATAAGPGATGALIDRGVDLPAQLNVMGAWSLAIGVLLAFVSRLLLARDRVAVPSAAR